MSTVALEQAGVPAVASHPTPSRIPLRRIVAVEARKSFDTRSGFWLLAGVAITAAIATGAVLLWAPETELTYESFTLAIAFPMAVILPIIAILSVTSEWSQRSGLTTFTLVPRRGRTILAKGLVALAVGVLSMILAMVIGALGNLAGSLIAGVETVWDVPWLHLGQIIIGNVAGLLQGFALGVLIRNSAGAIATYFVFSFVVAPLFILLAFNQQWFADLQPWVDFAMASGAMFEGLHAGSDWAHLMTASALWVLAPLALGLRLLARSEVT